MKKKIIIWSVAALLVLALAGIVLWLLLSGNSETQEEITPIQPPVQMTQEEAQKQIDENTTIILTSPENVDAALALADAYCAMNQLDKAREALSRAASLVPTDMRTYDKMLAIYSDNGMIKDALMFVDGITNSETKRQYEKKLRDRGFPGYTGSGNVANEGRIAGDGTKIYYSEALDGEALYSADPDGKNKVKLTEGKIRYITPIGDYIYFADLNQSHNVFRIKKDGTERTLVLDQMVTELTFLGDEMYFVNWGDGCKIYAANIDGTGLRKVNTRTSNYLSISGAWIYFVNQDDEFTLYRIKLDGTGEERLNDVDTSFVNGDREWVYYINWDDNGKIYRSGRDGGMDFVKLNDRRSAYMNVSGEHIYFVNLVERKVYRMNLDGSDPTKLSEDCGEAVHIVGDWVYYYNQDDGKRMYRCKKTGGGRELIGF